MNRRTASRVGYNTSAALTSFYVRQMLRAVGP